MPVPEHQSSSATTGARWFTTTHWSVVLSAGSSSAESSQSLEELCRLYWYPLYVYVRRKGYAAEDAKDLTQQFFARLLQGNRLALADPNRGRFRTYLLSALQNFLINDWVKAKREKRGGQFEFLSLDSTDPENLYTVEPADERLPETAYDRRWAAAVMAQAMAQLRADYTGERVRLFDALQACAWGGEIDTPLAQVAAQLQLSEGAVRVAIHRLRRRFRELLRQQVRQTVATDAEMEAELRYLIEVVSQNPV